MAAIPGETLEQYKARMLKEDPTAFGMPEVSVPRHLQTIDPDTLEPIDRNKPVIGDTGIAGDDPAPPAPMDATDKALSVTRGSMNAEQPAFPGGANPMGGSQMMPVGTSTYQRTQGPKPMKGAGQAIGKLTEQYIEGMKGSADVEKDLAGVETAALAEARKKISTLDQRSAEKVGKLEAERDLELGYYQQMRQEAANLKPDSQSWWKGRTGPQKVMAIIGMIAGAFNEGFTGGKVKNAAMTLIDREIDRDLAMQLEDSKNKRADRAESLNLVGTFTSLMKDEKAALANSKIMMLENLSLEMRQKAASVKDRRVQAQLLMTSSQVAQKAVLLQNQMHMMGQPTTKAGGSRQIFKAVPRAFLGGGRPFKDPNFLSKWQGRLGLIKELREVVADTRGKSLTPLQTALSWWGTDPARRLPRIRMLAQQIGRNLTRAEAGAMSNQDVTRVMENILGKEWDKSGAVVENLTRVANQAERTMRQEVMSFHADGYNVIPLTYGLYKQPGRK